MGSTIKTLMRVMNLTAAGDLPPGSAICDIGTTQLFGEGTEEGARSFLNFYASRTPKAKRPDQVPAETIKTIAAGGFLGELLELAGFEYTALDIFNAPRTVLFDLNIHEPGKKLAGRFDMVMNLGTTEHVFNQYRAFQTLHELTKPGGVIYHDLPMAGYLYHALFRYDPLFFRDLTAANGYEVLFREISMGGHQEVSAELRDIGYNHPQVQNVGIEMIVRRRGDAPFRVLMETSTSLAVDGALNSVTSDELVRVPAGTRVTYSDFVIGSASTRLLAKEVLNRFGQKFFGRSKG